MEITDIIGSGWAFPPRFDKNSGEVRLTQGLRNVAENLEIVVNTRLGERVLRRSFGSETHELMFKPFNANVASYLQESLLTSLEENEPRARIEKLSISQPNPQEGRLDIAIHFTVISTNESDNLVLPFYLPDLT